MSDPNAVVGCISRYTYPQIAGWVNSLNSCGFRGRRIVIYIDVDRKTIGELQEKGFETFDASIVHNGFNPALKKPAHPAEISVNRFYYLWHYFSRCRQHAQIPPYLILTDVRDVVFQRNPSDWLAQHLGTKKLLVGSESIRFEDEPWGARTFEDSYGPLLWQAHRKNMIYCAGVIAGEFQTIIDLCLQIYLMSPGHRVHYCDQMALNVLLTSKLYREITYFAELSEDWVFHASALANPEMIERSQKYLCYPTPRYDGRYLRSLSGEIYTIVHQFDRAPEWGRKLESLWNPESTEELRDRGKQPLVRKIISRLRG